MEIILHVLLTCIQVLQEENMFPTVPRSEDWLSRSWDMPKNAQEFKLKSQSKIACDYTWLHDYCTPCPSQRCFLWIFLTGSKPGRRSIAAAKEKKMWQTERQKNIFMKPKDAGHSFLWKSQNFDICTCPSNFVIKHGASKKKGMLPCCKCLFEKIGANLVHWVVPEKIHTPLWMGFWKFLWKGGQRLWISRQEGGLN